MWASVLVAKLKVKVPMNAAKWEPMKSSNKKNKKKIGLTKREKVNHGTKDMNNLLVPIIQLGIGLLFIAGIGYLLINYV